MDYIFKGTSQDYKHPAEIGENLGDLALSKDFLDITQKA